MVYCACESKLTFPRVRNVEKTKDTVEMKVKSKMAFLDIRFNN